MHKTSLQRRLIPLLLLSATFAIVWVYFTKEMYNYNRGFTSVFGLNVFPMIAWTIGLAVGYIVFSQILDYAKVKSVSRRFALFSLMSIVSVLIIETAGYYLLGVQNIGTSAYAGLPYCNCLHAPAWMQLGYFLMGPLYWITYTLLETFTHTNNKIIKRT